MNFATMVGKYIYSINVFLTYCTSKQTDQTVFKGRRLSKKSTKKTKYIEKKATSINKFDNTIAK